MFYKIIKYFWKIDIFPVHSIYNQTTKNSWRTWCNAFPSFLFFFSKETKSPNYVYKVTNWSWREKYYLNRNQRGGKWNTTESWSPLTFIFLGFSILHKDWECLLLQGSSTLSNLNNNRKITSNPVKETWNFMSGGGQDFTWFSWMVMLVLTRMLYQYSLLPPIWLLKSINKKYMIF